MDDPAKVDASLSDKANAAFQQAAAKVIQRAKSTRTPVVVWKDNEIKEIDPDELAQRNQ